MPPPSGDPTPMPGELFAGQYRVERVLGEGGMGVVVAAWDETNGRSVALKMLRFPDAGSVERFVREARAMTKLSSAHVARVFASGSVDGDKPYLVMERLEGMNLSDRVKRGGRVPEREVADIALQICEALSHAHASGIVHRDIKPSNVFVHSPKNGTPIVKLLDFGISKSVSRAEWERTLTNTADGNVLGSPPYMSPEHVRDPRTVDFRSDIWSLGILMYKLLATHVPFDGGTVGEVFAKILEAACPPLPADVSPEMRALVERCLAKKPEERHRTVGELAVALAPLASPELAPLAPEIAARTRDLVVISSSDPHTMTVAPPVTHAPIAVAKAPSPPSPVEAPPRARPLRLAALLVGAGVAGGLAIGLAVRTPRGQAEVPNETVVTTVTTASAASATSVASTPPPPTEAPIDSTTPPTVKSEKPTRRTFTRPKPASATTPPSASAETRPELQPSPYKR